MSEADQQEMYEFVDWLAKTDPDYENMSQDQIIQALNKIAETPEGQQKVQEYMNNFKQYKATNGRMATFKEGGKVNAFVCKYGKGGRAVDCGCKQGGGTVGKESNFNVPFLADMMTYFTGRKTPDVGNAKNRTFGYSRLGGNQYYRETADIDGNTTDTYVKITPQDTLLRQVLPSGRVNNLDASQRETVMSRFRPDIKRVNSKEEGGSVEKGLNGMSMGDAINSSMMNRGYNREQANMAYANAKNALRSQGLRGRELRQQARQILAGNAETTETPAPRASLGAVQPEARFTFSKPVITTPVVAENPGSLAGGSLESQLANNSRAVQDYSDRDFNSAFSAARNAYLNNNGANVFMWKGKTFNTNLSNNTAEPSRLGQAVESAQQYFHTNAPSTIGAVSYDGYRNFGENMRAFWRDLTGKHKNGGKIENE